MNRKKRKEANKILKSGWSAKNISFQLSLLFNQPEKDILRIINNLDWNIKHILTAFDNFPEAKTDIAYKKYNRRY